MSEPSPAHSFPTTLPLEVARLLFTEWLGRLAADRFGIEHSGHGSNQVYRYGSRETRYFQVEIGGDGWNWQIEVCDVIGIPPGEALRAVQDAVERAAAPEFGDQFAFESEIRDSKTYAQHVFGMTIHQARLMGDAVAMPNHLVRLGNVALLKFQSQNEDPIPAFWQTRVKVTIFAQGPTWQFAQQVANGRLEVVAAICALALGKAVEFDPVVFDIDAEDRRETVTEQQNDRSILTLARRGVSLDVFTEFNNRAGADAEIKVERALLAYHAAMHQSNADVATMLMVTSMEALVVPAMPWKKEKATKRFIKSIAELCPDVLSSAIEHPNVEKAFGVTLKGNKKRKVDTLLDRIYELRSESSHGGPDVRYVGFGTPIGELEERMAILSEIAREAILGFLESPRSFLYGHPVLDPAATGQ